MKILTREQIVDLLPSLDLLPRIEEAFVGYSAGRAVVPPVGELRLEKGDVHIKYGYLRGDEYYVIKIASGFPGNAELGLSTSGGMMLLFRQETGETVCALFDEGILTDLRTAVAGAVAARHLAPSTVERIGILGTGIQAHLQLTELRDVTECREVAVWGRNDLHAAQFVRDAHELGFRAAAVAEPAALLDACNLIVTTTPATSPLLDAKKLRPGTHLTAVGSDTPDKQELDTSILARADVIVADSIPQCLVRGEIHQALDAGAIDEERIVELGAVIAGHLPGRTRDDQITVADLTGVAVQDLAIAGAVFETSAS